MENNCPKEYVHYHAGGRPGSRPILTGKDAKPTFEEIPKIDMSPIFSESLEERKKVAAQVGKACKEVGFFYAVNHGVSEETIQGAFRAVENWFSQPEEVKLETNINQNKHFRGYEPLLSTQLDPNTRGDLKEAYMIGEDPYDPESRCPDDVKEKIMKKHPDLIPRNQWPKIPTPANQALRPAVYGYYKEMVDFARALLRTFALALDMPENHFDSIATFPKCNMRSLHYPSQEFATDVGIGAHTDYSCFTLVCQSTSCPSGLQVLNANGIWVNAPPVERTFVCNVGDFFQEATAGRFLSTVHRVVNKTGSERYSIPFFFAPNMDAEMAVVESCREPGKEYQPLQVGAYFKKRIAAARSKHPDGTTPEKTRAEDDGKLILETVKQVAAVA
ncbi:Clavaminate synthase-like protein [Rhizodiscina lignyota]|uniref:Clavaminate synthase-like protein n=1 Tax=Rhizodiscina lignyota TaxID=1504668 RepID=A0A9P4MEF1_9PEZI|nr:Clavaminate synthase-like protein [Rhizodiscina lignyota]